MSTTASPTLRARRLAFLVPGGLSLLAGLNGGLLLLGLWAPVDTARLEDAHGMLMVIGFVATLVSLERAVALRAPAGFLAPGLLGLGAITLFGGAPIRVGQGLFVAGMLAFVLVYRQLWMRQKDDATTIQGLGAVLGLGATIVWLGGVAIAAFMPFLIGFVVLTIIGERLELARLEISENARRAVVLLSTSLVGAAMAALLWPAVGTPIIGALLVALTVTMAANDAARRIVRSTGLPRYAAVCMLAGYFWLAIAGVIWLIVGRVESGAGYDAIIHAVFLGFTISMIMAHASVILPAVLRVSLPYHRAFYLPAGLLHLSLVIRLLVGDAWGHDTAWQLGGALNVAAVLMFVVLAVGRAITSTGVRS